MDKENSKGASRTRRGKDFSPQETSTLMEFVSANKKELFGTGGKGSSKEEKVKIRTWKRAGHALRAAGGPEREWSTIRKKWRDLSSKAKAYNAPKTGGGPAPEKNPALERVLEILAKEVVEGILPEDDLMESQESAITDDEQLEENQTWSRQHQLHASSSISSSSSSAAAAASVPPTSTSSSSAAAFSSSSSASAAAAVPASKQKHPKPAQHHPKLSPKPAQIRQLEIQERLLSIQEAKLKVKQQSVQIQQAMLEELKSINYSLRATLAPINQSNNQQYQGYDFNPLV